MAKADFAGLESMVALFTQLLEGRTVTTASIERDLGFQRPAAGRRLELLETLPGAIRGRGKQRSVRLPQMVARQPMDGNAVAGICLISSLATALHQTAMLEPVLRIREEWIGRSKHSYSTEDLDRKFWFVIRGGEKALPKNATRLGELIEALLDSNEVTFDYVHFEGNRENIRVEPLTLAVHEHQLYLIARRAHQRPRPFRFARMSNLRKGKQFAYPSVGEYDPRQVFQNVFGIFIGLHDERIERVRLRFDPRWAHYIPSHRWHDTQVESRPNADGSIEVELNVRICPELRNWILGFGPEVEVLEPGSLRDDIAARHIRAAQRYLAASEPKEATPSTTSAPPRKSASRASRTRAR